MHRTFYDYILSQFQQCGREELLILFTVYTEIGPMPILKCFSSIW